MSEQEKSVKSSTTSYRVLVREDNSWSELMSVQARSAQSAITKVARGVEGVYVAVPERSFRPTALTLERPVEAQVRLREVSEDDLLREQGVAEERSEPEAAERVGARKAPPPDEPAEGDIDGDIDWEAPAVTTDR